MDEEVLEEVLDEGEAAEDGEGAGLWADGNEGSESDRGSDGEGELLDTTRRRGGKQSKRQPKEQDEREDYLADMGPRPLLYIGEERDVDLEKTPESAVEYLLQVRKQASLLPDFVVADVHSTQQGAAAASQFGDVGCEAREQLQPSCKPPPADWETGILADFSEARQAFLFVLASNPQPPANIPKFGDSDAWRQFTVGHAEASGHDPSIALLGSLKHHQVAWLLNLFIHWSDKELNERHAKWIYALIATIEKPVSCNIMSILRDLHKHCTALLLEKQKRADGDGDGNSSSGIPAAQDLVPLHLFRSIISKYYSQRDLL